MVKGQLTVSYLSLALYHSAVAILGILLTILLMLVILLVSVYRYFVVVIAKCVLSDLVSIVSPIDIVYGRDFEKWNTNPDSTILTTLVIDSNNYSLQKLRDYMENLINCSNSNLSRLQMYMVPFLGYAFWKNDVNFNINHHVKFYPRSETDSNCVDEKWLNQTRKILLKKPYEKNRSAWEIIIVRNYISSDCNRPRTLFIFRLNHGMGDGISLFKLFPPMSENSPLAAATELKKFSKTKRSGFNVCRLLSLTGLILKAPYDIVKNTIEVNDYGKTPWCEESNFTGISSIAQSKPISLEDIKMIRKKFNVQFMCVVLSGITCILRHAMILKKIEIPDFIHIHLPFPLPNHPEKFCNHMTSAFLPVPVGISDPVERLQKINSDFENLKSSSVPSSIACLTQLLGFLPYCVAKRTKSFVTSLGSIFPGPAVALDNHGAPVEEINFAISVPVPFFSSGILICGLTYNGVLTIVTNFDTSIIESDELIVEMHQIMYNELEQLKFK